VSDLFRLAAIPAFILFAAWSLDTPAPQEQPDLTACNQPCADVGGPGGVAGMKPIALVGEQCVCAVTVELWAPLEDLDAVEVDGD